MNDTTDVAVIGGGLVGCLCALRLADAGAKVTVLEKSVPGAEASSAAAGILAAQSEGRAPGLLFALGLESRGLYKGLADELRARVGADIGYGACGALELARTDAALDDLERAFAWQRSHGLSVARLTARELAAREPSLDAGYAGALAFDDDAQVDPPRLLAAVAQAAERAGVCFRSGAYVRRVQSANGRVTGVELDDRVVAASHVLLAAGAWSALVEGAAVPEGAVRPARGQIVELVTRTPPARAVLYGEGGYIVPRPDGRVVCGSTLEFVGFRNEVTAGGVLRIVTMAIALLPALEHAKFARAWSNFRPHTPDGAPLVGGAPGLDGLTIATGHYRSGILMAPVTARLVCERIMGSTLAVEPVELSPSRASLRGPDAGRSS